MQVSHPEFEVGGGAPYNSEKRRRRLHGKLQCFLGGRFLDDTMEEAKICAFYTLYNQNRQHFSAITHFLTPEHIGQMLTETGIAMPRFLVKAHQLVPEFLVTSCSELKPFATLCDFFAVNFHILLRFVTFLRIVLFCYPLLLFVMNCHLLLRFS